MAARILLLGGTREARELAAAVDGDPGLHVVTSLAGRPAGPARPGMPPGEIRVGGFGGPEALSRWLREHGTDLVVDATHPFAQRISASAVTAARSVGVPLLVVRRPGWRETVGDDWLRVPDVDAAASAVGAMGERVMLTVGRRVAPFARVKDRWFLVRSVEPPRPPTPPRMRVVLARGPFSVAGERDMLSGHRIDVLVTKDSGGDSTSAKLVACRELRIPVVMVDRPSPAVPEGDPVDVVASSAGAVRWLRRWSRRGAGSAGRG